MAMIRMGDVELWETRPGVWIRVMIDERVGSRQVALVRGKLAPGAVLPLHYHDVEEAFTVISGEGLSEIGGECFRLAAGDALLIPASAHHQLRNPSASEDLVFAACFPANRLVLHPVQPGG
ncbi:MAG: cupin domain-containing protein [Chloroflexi bacterium]|nr:cupin domain-containing protein [Chloroflexota bacterium]